MPTDYLTEVYRKAWTLLRASADVLEMVKLTNQIDLTDADTHPLKPSLTDADTPELALGMGGIKVASWEQDPSYFYSSDPDGAGSRTLVTIEQELILTLTHEDLRIEPSNQITVACIRALIRGGYDWGLSYVNSWGPMRANRRVAKAKGDEGRSVDRLVTQITVPVLLEMPQENILPLYTRITAVRVVDNQTLTVEFDRRITALAATWLNFKVTDNLLGILSPMAVVQAGLQSLTLTFAGGADLSIGDAWSVTDSGTGITYSPALKLPASGATLIND